MPDFCRGGCQAEIVLLTMAAAVISMAAGGTPFQASQAIQLAKNIIGIICDPCSRLVEVHMCQTQCHGKFSVAADMALAGITSAIPVDQVVDAMYQVGSAMPTAFRETAEGGLAATQGKAL